MEHLLPSFVTKHEYAQRKRISRSSVQHKITTGDITAVKVGLSGFEMIDWDKYKSVRFTKKTPKKMGHDLFAWPGNFSGVTPGTLAPDGNVIVKDLKHDTKLRLTSKAGKSSPLYKLLKAESSNNIDSGNGDFRIYPPVNQWPDPPNIDYYISLTHQERLFWKELQSYPHGFIILFE